MYGLRRSPIRAALQNTDVKLDRVSAKDLKLYKEGFKIPILVLVHDGREDAMCVRACADEQENNQQQRLEVEEGRLPTC
jgi:hypothetical protein